MRAGILALVASSSGMLLMVGLAIGWWFRISILGMSECRASRENTGCGRTFDEKTAAISGIGHVYISGHGTLAGLRNLASFLASHRCQQF